MFDVKDFISNPLAEIGTLKYATKDQITFLLISYGIKYKSSSTLKDRVQILRKYLCDEGAISETDLVINDDEFTEVVNPSTESQPIAQKTPEVLALEFEMLKFTAAEAEKQRVEARLEAEKQRQHEEKQRQHEEKQRQHEIQLAQLNQLKTTQQEFDLTKHTKVVPEFLEGDPEGYFKIFEDTARQLKWPKQYWRLLLSPKLKGIAAETFVTLSVDADYEEVKAGILDAYSITVEGYRQAFRSCSKSAGMTYFQFVTQKF